MLSKAQTIIRETASRHWLTVADLIGPSQERRIAYPRQEAMWRLRRELGLTSTVIGRLLRRDHSTVLHGVRAYEERLRVPDDPLGRWPCFHG